MADLTIVVDVRDNQTMSTYKVPESGKVTFENASSIDSLVISPKAEQPPLPFCNGNETVPVPPIKSKDSYTAHLCKGTEGEFLYTAQIGTAASEDPIVIIEKPKLNVITPATAFIIGAALAAAATYLILKSRAGAPRPQQG